MSGSLVPDRFLEKKNACWHRIERSAVRGIVRDRRRAGKGTESLKKDGGWGGKVQVLQRHLFKSKESE